MGSISRDLRSLKWKRVINSLRNESAENYRLATAAPGHGASLAECLEFAIPAQIPIINSVRSKQQAQKVWKPPVDVSGSLVVTIVTFLVS